MNITARSISLVLIFCFARFVSGQFTNDVFDGPSSEAIAKQKAEMEQIGKLALAEQSSHPWYKTNGEILPKEAAKKLMIRPAGLDDDGWRYYKMFLYLLLEDNQPIEFYARVVDQDAKPIPGARLELQLSGVDTDKVLAKFPHMNMGEEQTHWTNVMFSDSNGWIRLKGIAGHYLNVWGYASKEGYSSKYPDGNFGTICYETRFDLNTNHTQIKRTTDIRISTSDLTMDALNPTKGFVFQLLKTNVAPQ